VVDNTTLEGAGRQHRIASSVLVSVTVSLASQNNEAADEYKQVTLAAAGQSKPSHATRILRLLYQGVYLSVHVGATRRRTCWLVQHAADTLLRLTIYAQRDSCAYTHQATCSVLVFPSQPLPMLSVKNMHIINVLHALKHLKQNT
jgi:hypothetical protein